MKRDEQHKKVLKLRECQKKMSPGDLEAFEMMAKRDHDEEEFDALTLGQLNSLYERYFLRKSKGDLEQQWKKLTHH